MERKRKLPPRAAAREHVAKKRTATPSDESRSNTPASAPPPPEESNPPSNHPQPLPVSIHPGQPLPTIEVPQPDDLSGREFQSIPESRVLAESLSRSRQKWIDGLFEKYWTKPSKRKGIPDDPNNPPKDSMHKLGTVAITVEPHVFEATIYTVKDPRPDPPAVPAPVRPFIQYGPPGGVMPPPPPPRAPTPATPASTTQTISVVKPSQPPTPTEAKTEPGQTRPATATGTAPAAPAVPAQMQPVPPSRGIESVLSPPAAPAGPARPQTATQPSPSPSVVSLSTPPPRAGTAPNAAKGDPDPIIVALAEKASSDPKLRDLMKKVAVGEAQKEELAQFQRIIDHITAEYRKKGGQQGPSADRLVVDGRTVKYFANEVKTILNIIIRSNPKQRGVDLKAPVDGDPLVIALVRKGLDDVAIREKIMRVSENHPQFSDATDLKALLDQLKNNLAKETEKAAPSRTISPGPVALGATHAPQPALRSKGPPPPPILKRDISTVVIEFSGGTGDRYLFPKFSILDAPAPVPASPYQQLGQLVIASFLIVRKGSTSEYGGDPSLDYYQPITIRIQGPNTRHYEALQKVVAPVEEVRRYMDDVMDNMTRAEYVLLAMRLPREDKKDLENGDAVNGSSGAQTNGHTSGFNTPKIEPGLGGFPTHQPTPPAVLWTASATAKATPPPLRPGPVMRKPVPDEDAQYQSLIGKVGKKTVEEVA